MNIIAIIFGAAFGALSVVFGAFGAHLLKNKLSKEQLQSFETGVKYQMYHAIVLLVLGFQLNSEIVKDNYIVYSFSIGIILFSFSIYGLVLSSAKQKKLTFLGPITPLGGLFLLLGWVLLLVKFI